MPKIKLSITLSEELIEDIDKKRGLIPRSAYIEHALQKIRLKKLFFLLPFVFLFLLSPQFADAGNITLQPGVEGNDTYIREDAAGWSGGGALDQLNFGFTTDGNRMRALFQFNL